MDFGMPTATTVTLALRRRIAEDVPRPMTMIPNTTDLVDPKVGPRRGWPKASAGRLLSLAAAPTFAVMALLTVAGGGAPDALCSAAHASPLSGMVAMYL